MDTTLAVNPGSASKKYALFQNGREVLSVLFERTGEGFGKCVEVNGERQHCEDISATAYQDSLRDMLAIAVREGVVTDARNITRVALRIVAPGSYFMTHRVVDERYCEKLMEVTSAAPLHIPHILEECASVTKLLPHAKIIGASDSAFHASIPDYARTYSIPREDTEKLDVYRFGYHGLSVGSVVKEIAEMNDAFPERLIIAHIGSGVSITAIAEGKSVDTSMGFAPGSGLMMATRAGDIDPSALLYILNKKGLWGEKAEAYVNRACGLEGVLGSSDLRIALDRYTRGEHQAVLAINMYMYRIQKTIASYVAALGGLDMLVFTATAPERNPLVRALVCERLAGCGIVLDVERNESLVNRSGIISPEESDVTVAVEHTSEMKEMAAIAESL